MESLAELRWMLPPLAICLILAGIHGYLGIHVLARKVIFVDLALAQIAALGTTYAFMLGYDPKVPEDASVVYWFSLGFTVLGAAVFALTRMRHEKVPHEAFIGITYATASAIAILILSKSTAEGEHLKSMLVGNILLVTWPVIGKTAAIYALVGMFHTVFFRRFLAISADPEGAEAAGVPVRLWDFLFYMTFGFVITSSVSIAGVLLVFTYLVVPASIAMLFADTFAGRITIAWATGTVCSMVGMAVSYYGDLPTGPAVVGVFATALILCGVGLALVGARNRSRATIGVIAAVACLTLAVRGSVALRKPDAPHRHESTVERLLAALASGNETEQIDAIHHLSERREPHALAAIVTLLEDHPSDRLIEHAAEALGRFGEPAAVPTLLATGERDLDPDLQLTVAEAVFKLHDPRGMGMITTALRNDPPPLARRRARELLQTYFGQTFGYDPDAPPAARAAAVDGMEGWWKGAGPSLRWHGPTARFE